MTIITQEHNNVSKYQKFPELPISTTHLLVVVITTHAFLHPSGYSMHLIDLGPMAPVHFSTSSKSHLY